MSSPESFTSWVPRDLVLSLLWQRRWLSYLQLPMEQFLTTWYFSILSVKLSSTNALAGDSMHGLERSESDKQTGI